MDDNPLLNEDDASPRRPSPEEIKVVNQCLKAVAARAAKFQLKGLSTTNFCLGVSNTLFVAWSFGAIPQHFWLVYVLQVFVLFPMRWKHMTNAEPKEHYYWLDFCWCANFMGVIAIFVLGFDASHDVLTTSTRLNLFCMVWGIACGPLLLATALVGNAMVFHDADNVASCLIHLFPSLVMYTIGWHHAELHEAWPRVFHLDYLDEVTVDKIYSRASVGYVFWFVLYTSWLILCGMRLPQFGYDTIFHANMRGGLGKLIAKARGTPLEQHKENVRTDNFTRKDALVYMLGHAIGSLAAIWVGALCFINRYFHGIMCAAMTLFTIYTAAGRYQYYMLRSYGDAVRKELGIPLNRNASAMYE